MEKLIYMNETLTYLKNNGVDIQPIVAQGVVKALDEKIMYLVITVDNDK